MILYGRFDPDTNACTFTGLSSAQQHIVTCDGHSDGAIIVSEGRRVNFFSSFGSVPRELFGSLTRIGNMSPL